MPFSGKAEVIRHKTERELLVQATREIESEWSGTATGLVPKLKKEKPESVVERIEAR